MILPIFTFAAKQPKVPFRHSVVASFKSRDIPGRAGVIEFKVTENHPHTRWWVSASCDGFRMTNTLATSSRTVAEKWIAEVKAGRVTLVEKPE